MQTPIAIQQTDKLIVSIGELLWDVLPEGKRPGGAPANLVYHAANNGVRAVAVTAVGDDPLGREIVERLQNNGVTTIAQINGYPTGTVDVTVDKGIPAYRINTDVAWDHIQLTDEIISLVASADAVCYGSTACRQPGTSRDTIYALLNKTRDDAMRFLDINLREGYDDAAVLGHLIDSATVLKLNKDELDVLRHLFDITVSDSDDKEMALLEALEHRFDLRGIVFTDGDSHITVIYDGEVSRIATLHVPVVDTVGAGDAFSGVFIADILRGKTVGEAHRDAVNLAAYSCTQAGAWPKYATKTKTTG